MSTDYDAKRFGSFFLNDILNWIAENLAPDEVYKLDEIKSWADDDGVSPSDLFSDDALEEWALENRFAKEEEKNIVSE